MPVAGKHILIVDDNQEILNMITLVPERYLFKFSAQIRVSDFIYEMWPDPILMDKNLGWADGCDLCALVKTDKELRHIPVIMHSAYHKLKEDCLFAGADAFFEKPFEMTKLLETIHSFAVPEQAPTINHIN
jgi:CheY-like chemotaxis protein